MNYYQIMVRYFHLFLFIAALLLQACGNGNKTTEVGDIDTTSVIDSFEIETEIDTNAVSINEGFDTIYSKLASHRFIRFPRFQSASPTEWMVCNEVYGASLLVAETQRHELLDSLIEYRINQYIATNRPDLRKANQNITYSQMEEFINRFYPTAQGDLNADEEQIRPQLEADFELFISCYYQRLLKDLPDNRRLRSALKTEHMAWRIFRSTQIRLVNIMNEGNAPSEVVTNLMKSISEAKTRADVDLYYSLGKSSYQPDQTYEKIPEQFFYDVYNGYIKDIKDTKQIGIGPKIQILMREQKTWMSFIFARKLLAQKLTKEQKEIYENATNRLQKWHLVQLQNRFAGYGYCSDAFRSSLLSDTCSYPALYKYVPMKLGAQF